MKNKKGFTLAEILLVVAIIAILSGATLVGVSSLVNNSKATASKVQNDAQNFELAAASKVKGAAGNVPSNAVETETLNTKSSNPTPSESQKPADPSTPASVPSKDPSGSQPSGSEPAGTTSPSVATTPSAPSQGGSTGNGAASFSGDPVKRGDPGSGVMSVTQNNDGSTTFGLLYNQWNDGAVTIWKNADGTYAIQGVSNGGNVIGNALASAGCSFDWNDINNNKKFTLTSEQASALSRIYGFNFN